MDIDKLLSKVDLIELATRAGAKFNGNRNGKGQASHCPLHHGDNQTAFYVSTNDNDRQLWYCFSRCQEGGDAINFMMKWQGLDFIHAVQELAYLYHIPFEELQLNSVDIQMEDKKRARSKIMAIAAHYYHEQLLGEKGTAAREYLFSRGFTKGTIHEAQFGFSDFGLGLGTILARENVDLSIPREIGLVRNDGFDFTVNAGGMGASPNGFIIYPHFHHNQINYFSSRAVEIPGTSRPDPKDKSRNLPGPRQIYKADRAGALDQVIVVEGPADARSLWQVGFSSWALCGLGEMPDADLASLKKRGCIYLSPDNDATGQEKLEKVESKLTIMANSLGPLTMVLPPIPEGKDYNEWLQKGLSEQGIAKHLKLARTWLETRLGQCCDCKPNELDERMLEIGKLLIAIPEQSRPRYINLTHRILGITRKEVYELISSSSGKNNGHIVSSIRDGQLCFLSKPLGNFQAAITHELMIDDGQNPPSVRYTVAGKLITGQPLETIDIDAEEFASLKWIPKHWGARPVLYVSSSGYYEVSRAVQEVSIEMKRERVHTYTGWAEIDKQRSYLSGSGRITKDGLDPTTRVDLGINNLRFYNLPQPPIGEELLNACKASLDFLHIGNREVTAPIWAAIFAAPLTSITPLYAVLWVYGPTQSGKSTITHLALTHFGPGFIQARQYHAPMDWTSTATALEGAMFAVKDAPIVIDDFAPQFASATDSRDMHRKAHYVIRSVGNRSSRGRARADLTERTVRVPRGLVIATAENPLLGQSIVGRMLYIPVARGDVLPVQGDNPLLNQAQADGQAGKYAGAMAAYLQYLIKNWDNIAKSLPEFIEKSNEYIKQYHPELQNRLPDYFSVLNAAQTLAMHFFQDMGIITAYDAGQELAANRDSIIAVIAQQAERIAAESPVKKVIEALGSLLEQKKIYLSPSTKDQTYTPPDHSDPIGWFNPRDGEVVYLSTDIALMKAKGFWREMDENLDILPDALRRQMSQAGILKEIDQKGQHIEVVKWINGKSRRVLAINRQKVIDLYGVSLENEITKAMQSDEEIPF